MEQSTKAGKVCTLEKTETTTSVRSHGYINLDLFFLRRHRSFAQAVYCADPFVMVTAAKYKDCLK